MPLCQYRDKRQVVRMAFIALEAIHLDGEGPRRERGQGMTKSTNVPVPRSLEEILRPESCALVVYDMQVGILSQLPHGPDVLAKVLEVLEILRRRSA